MAKGVGSAPRCFSERTPRDTMIWSLIRREYPGSPSAAAEVVAPGASEESLS